MHNTVFTIATLDRGSELQMRTMELIVERLFVRKKQRGVLQPELIKLAQYLQFCSASFDIEAGQSL